VTDSLTGKGFADEYLFNRIDRRGQALNPNLQPAFAGFAHAMPEKSLQRQGITPMSAGLPFRDFRLS
jgi:hypothetical protein